MNDINQPSLFQPITAITPPANLAPGATLAEQFAAFHFELRTQRWETHTL